MKNQKLFIKKRQGREVPRKKELEDASWTVLEKAERGV